MYPEVSLQICCTVPDEVTDGTVTGIVVADVVVVEDTEVVAVVAPSGNYAYIGDHYNTYVNVNPAQQVSNPYAGGSTGFFGNLPGATTATTSVSSTTTTSATTIPVTVFVAVFIITTCDPSLDKYA